MRYCGQAAKMEYSPVVSNAKSADAVYALRHYFGYDEGIFLAHRSNYTIDGWEDLIYGEMAEGRPVFYGANSADEGGHVLSVMDMMVRDCIILIGAGRAGMTTTSLSPCLIHTKLKI
ncbi:MAG: C10 family peptidase [Prevotella sp.]|nr:C10 family peptidase [Prevotella sp.]